VGYPGGVKAPAIAALQEIRDTFGLTRSELADLVGRRPQSISEWASRGIPKDRHASVERLVDLARLFHRRVIASRIPQIVRTPDARLGGRTMLEALRADGVDPIYAYLGRLITCGLRRGRAIRQVAGQMPRLSERA
jgi:DNA-binding XRE family transcriptional regulator